MNPLLNAANGVTAKQAIELGVNLGKIACNDSKVYNMLTAMKEPSASDAAYLTHKCNSVGVNVADTADMIECVNKLGDKITCTKKTALGSVAVFWIMFVMVVLLAALLITGEVGSRVKEYVKKLRCAPSDESSVYVKAAKL